VCTALLPRRQALDESRSRSSTVDTDIFPIKDKQNGEREDLRARTFIPFGNLTNVGTNLSESNFAMQGFARAKGMAEKVLSAS